MSGMGLYVKNNLYDLIGACQCIKEILGKCTKSKLISVLENSEIGLTLLKN